MPATLTDGLDTLLSLLQPRGQPIGTASFPHAVEMAQVKMTEAESAHSWFKRCVDGPLGGEALRCSVEPNLAVFATVKWSGKLLDYANIQILKTQVSLEDFYLGDGVDEAFLLRLDWDYGTLGPIFTHALPHVHASSFDAAPRFGIDGIWSENILAEYFEFAYRHLFHPQWLEWVRRIWKRERGTNLREEDPIERIIEAFQDSNIQALRAHKDAVASLKNILRTEKDDWCSLRVREEDLTLLRYPA